MSSHSFPTRRSSDLTPNTNFSYNARGVRTFQYIDNLTYIHGNHTLKGGINFRFNLHKDDRSNVAGSAIEPVVTLSNVAGTAAFNIPAAGATSINATDRTRLENTIVDLLGRVNTVSQAFVAVGNTFDVEDEVADGGFGHVRQLSVVSSQWSIVSVV